MEKNNISIHKVFWSVPDLEFADNILSTGLKIKKIKPKGKYSNSYQLSNCIKIIAFIEHNSGTSKFTILV